MSLNPTVWVTFLTTLAGAFFGAWFAFLLDARTKRKIADQLSVRNGNLALYNLYTYWNVFRQYYEEVIKPFESRPDAWLNMPPTANRMSDTESLRDIDLSFLLGLPQASVYSEVNLEEHRFRSACRTIELRDEILLTEARPAMIRAGMAVGGSHAVSAVESAMGVDRAHALRDLTKGAIENVSENLLSLEDAFKLLRGAMIEIFPKAKFISFEFPDEFKNTT